MPLIKDGQEAKDAWRRWDKDQAPPDSGDLILSTDQLLKFAEETKNRSGRTGLHIKNNVEVATLKEALPYIALIALEFPAFNDGRAYSQAWQLRSDLGFQGELRATGNVLPDQAAFMLRAGFDSFLLEEGKSIETLKSALTTMTHAYQSGVNDRTNDFRRKIAEG